MHTQSTGKHTVTRQKHLCIKFLGVYITRSALNNFSPFFCKINKKYSKILKTIKSEILHGRSQTERLEKKLSAVDKVTVLSSHISLR